jgi:hypothetical protein
MLIRDIIPPSPRRSFNEGGPSAHRSYSAGGQKIKRQRQTSKKALAILTILFLILQFFAGLEFLFPKQAKAAGTIYYVDSSITDTNTASATPDFTTYNPTTFATDTGSASVYKTIADVNLKSFSAGDSILFRRGQTWRETLTVPSSGSTGSPITFGAYGDAGAAKPIFDGADVITGWVADSTNEETGGSFACGFETEIDAFTTQFTSKVEANSNTLAVSSTYSSGLKSAVLTFAGTSGLGTAASKTIGSNIKYARTYFKLSSGFTAGAGGQKLGLFMITNPAGWGNLGGFLLVSDTGETTKFHLSGGYRYPGSTWTEVGASANNSILRDTWYYIEIHYEKANTTVEYWLNGVSLGSATVDASTYNTNGVGLGVSAGSYITMIPTVGSQIYFDDVKADTSPIGAYSAPSPVANVYNKAVAAQPIQVFKDGVRLVQGSSKAALNDHEWYYSGGTLSMRDDSGNPDLQGYTIMASQRNYNIDMNGKNYITIDNLDIARANQDGIYDDNPLTNTAIENCIVRDSGYHGINLEGNAKAGLVVSNNTIYGNESSGVRIADSSNTDTTMTFTRNTIYENCTTYTGASPFDFTGGIALWGHHITAEVSYNLIYNNGGTTTNGGSGVGIWFDTLAAGSVAKYNLIYGNRANGIFIEKTSSSSVYNNIVYSNASGANYTAGILVKGNDNTGANNTNANLIYNNTLYDNNAGGASTANISVQTWDSNAATAPNSAEASHNRVVNNITYSTTGQDLQAWYGGGNADTTYGNGHDNLYYNNSVSTDRANFLKWNNTNYATLALFEAATLSTAYININADPLFTNAVGNDFTLQSTSPARDAGTNLGSTYDDAIMPGSTWPSSVTTIDQDLRGAGWEIGAYVYPVPQSPTIGTPEVLSDSSIRWNFQDNSNDETGFHLYNSDGATVASQATANLSYVDETGLSCNTSYSGRYVKAYNSYGESVASTVAPSQFTDSCPSGGFLPPSNAYANWLAQSSPVPTLTPSPPAGSPQANSLAPPTQAETGSTNSPQAPSAGSGQAGTNPSSPQSQSLAPFAKYLRFSQVSADVKRLQIFLNQSPDTQIAKSGAGSSGKETNLFGRLTKAAVIKFQEKYTEDILAPWKLTKGTGFVGKTTTAKINQLLGF